MSLDACAEIVRRGDPDRFRAVMAAPVPARARLLPLYAFNVEVARAPWVTGEPLIAEMRLQWWRDALDEIAAGQPVRRHEVATPLGAVLDPGAARQLDALVAARRCDVDGGPADMDQLDDYLRDTGGRLMAVAGQVLGAPTDDGPALDLQGRGLAAANWLLALPNLARAGKPAFCHDRPDDLAALAARGRAQLAGIGRQSRPGRIAGLAAWKARAVLVRAQADPAAATGGRLEPGAARQSLLLLRAALGVSLRRA